MSSKALLGFVYVGVITDAKTVSETSVTSDTRACLPPHDQYGFCEVTKSTEDRVEDLISRLNDDEIPALLTARQGSGGSPGPPGNISRLGLPEYDWGVNCLHGVQTSCVKTVGGDVKCPTSFPNPVNFGATWNDSHSFVMGQVIADELRALWLAGATEYSSWSGRPHAGLDCWSPNINIARDPRWGRNQEVPSEDPLINGRFGSGYTQGLQGGSEVASDEKYVKAVVTLKHWDAYGLEDSDGFTRHNVDAKVSNYTLQDTFWPAWKQSVQEGKALGVMCSYNALNGVPTCADPLLKHVLRDVWGFEGYMSSDTGALSDIYKEHKYVSTGEEAVCAALSDGGTDISSDSLYHDYLLKAMQQGTCSRDALNEALRHTLGLRFKLGLFDGNSSAYWNVPMNVLGQNDESVRLATLESMVLLSNGENVLPIKAGKKIAVIGPHAQAKGALVGNYLGQLCPDDTLNCVENPLEAISRFNVNGNTTFAQGCPLTKDDESQIQDAVDVAAAADVVVLLLGIDEKVEAESHDRTTIDLPGVQHKLAAAILSLQKPTVMVLVNGGMVAIEEEAKAEGPLAILEAFYPGMMGADAIATTIFGENDHLGGKLPITVYNSSYINEIKMSEMELNVGIGRTYKYFKGTPVFPFGHGLSLTSFDIANVVQSGQVSTDGSTTVTITMEITNTGNRAGDEVVQAYFVPQSDVMPGLKKRLFDYKRVHLQPGQSTEVAFNINRDSLKVVKSNGDIFAVPGKHTVLITNGNVGAQGTVSEVDVVGIETLLEQFPSVPAQPSAAVMV